MLSHSSGASPSAGAAVLQTGNLGVRLHLSPHVVFYVVNCQRMHGFFPMNALKRRNCLTNTVKKEEKWPYMPSAYILAQAAVRTPGTVVFWLLHFQRQESPGELCPQVAFAVSMLGSQIKLWWTFLLLCVPVCWGSGFSSFKHWLCMREEYQEEYEVVDFRFRLYKAWNWLWGGNGSGVS